MGASGPELGSSEGEQLISTYEKITSALAVGNYVDALFLRDRIQSLLTSQKLQVEQVRRVQAVDISLKRRTSRLGREVETQKAQFRETMLPPICNWWWQPKDEPLLWNVISVVMLAIIGALATQFAARILSRNPDAWGISAVILQGVLTLLAGGTFTSAGKSLLKKLGLGRIAARGRACFATVFGIIVIALWYFAPTALADRYNRLGLAACPSNLTCPDLDVAITMFERASSLDLNNSMVHFNFGRVYELAYNYDKAIQQYQQAVEAAPESPSALSNWARLLLIQKKDTALALALLDDAARQADNRLKQGPFYSAAPSIYKNRGLANYQAGFYVLAAADLRHSLELQRQLATAIAKNNSTSHNYQAAADIASPHCLLAMTESKLANPGAALDEAKRCVELNDKSVPQETGAAPKVDAESIRFARGLVQKQLPNLGESK